jgi:hypothetical protein
MIQIITFIIGLIMVIHSGWQLGKNPDWSNTRFFIETFPWSLIGLIMCSYGGLSLAQKDDK